MEEAPRLSLWCRLVVFYSINKPEQLNAKVMAEIIAKYGSREKELSARLLSKYGQAIPPSVPAAQLRQVLGAFSMEDEDARHGGGVPSESSEAAAAAAHAVVPTPKAECPEGVGGEGGAKASVATSQEFSAEAEQDVPPGSSLDFRSKHFDPEKALRHETLRPPYPRQPCLDNVYKFFRLLPKLPPTADVAAAAAEVATQAATGGGRSSSPGESSPPATAAAEPADWAAGTTVAGVAVERTAGLGGGKGMGGVPGDEDSGHGGSSSVGGFGVDGRSGGVSSPCGSVGAGGVLDATGSAVDGSRDPAVLICAEALSRADREKAKERMRRIAAAAEALPRRNSSNIEEFANPIARIAQEYQGTGPYSLLYRLHRRKKRANVMIRRINSVRGTCTGLIRAFDKHMNLLLVDVTEDYTSLVPAHDPKPTPEAARGAETDRSRKEDTDDGPAMPKVREGRGRKPDDGRTSRSDDGRQMLGTRNYPGQNAVSSAGEGSADRERDEEEEEQEEEEEEVGRSKGRSRRRRSRHKGPWRGDLVSVRRQRYLKQLLIRGDNVVMIWETPKF